MIKIIKSIFELNEIKELFFFTILSDIIDNLINNLIIRDIIIFVDIKPKIFNITKKYFFDSVDFSIYFIKIRKSNEKKVIIFIINKYI